MNAASGSRTTAFRRVVASATAGALALASLSGTARALSPATVAAAPASGVVLAAPGGLTDAQVQQLEAAIKAGSEHLRKKQYEKALAEFEKAWAIDRNYKVAGLLGQAELLLRRWRNAAEHLEYCLRKYPESGDPRGKERIAGGLAEAKKHVGTVNVVASPPGARLLLDGEAIGQAPLEVPVFVESGEHTFSAENGDQKPLMRTITVAGGEETSVQLHFASTGFGPAAKPTGPSKTDPGDATQKQPSDSGTEGDGGGSAKPYVVMAGAGLTLVAVGLGAYFQIRRGSLDSDASSLRSKAATEVGAGNCGSSGGGSSTCQKLFDTLEDRGGATSNARIGFIAAGVFAVGTAAAFFLWPDPESDASGRNSHRKLAAPSVSLQPVAGPDGGGVWMTGRF